MNHSDIYGIKIYFEKTENPNFFKGIAQRNRSRRLTELKRVQGLSQEAVALVITLIGTGGLKWTT